MNADTAVAIMESLDEAEDLLSRMRLRDGWPGRDALVHNRELLEAARHRLERVHAVPGMGGFASATA